MINKLFNIILTAGLSVLLLSCVQKEETPSGTGDWSGSFAATAESVVQTKGGIDGTTGKFTWKAGDRIAVYATGGGGKYFNCILKDDSDGEELGDFEERYYGTRTNYAVYPVWIAKEDYPGPTDLRVKLPYNYLVEKTVEANTVSQVPMVAVNNDSDDPLVFKYLCGVLRLELKSVPSGTKCVKVVADKYITGDFVVQDPGTSTPHINALEGSVSGNGQEVTFTFPSTTGSGNADNIVLDLPLPVGIYHCIRVYTFSNTTTTTTSFTRFFVSTYPVNIQRATGHRMEVNFIAASGRLTEMTVEDQVVNLGASLDIEPTIKINKTTAISATTGVSIVATAADPTIVEVSTVTLSTGLPGIRLKGLKTGTTKLISYAVYGDQILYSREATITVTAENTYLRVDHAEKMAELGKTALYAYLMSGSEVVEADSYTWTLTGGPATLASLDERAVITSTGGTGDVTFTCTATLDGKSFSISTRTITVVTVPAGVLRAVYSTNTNGDYIFFSRSNLSFEKDEDPSNPGRYKTINASGSTANANNGHFEIEAEAQWDYYTGRKNTTTITTNTVPRYDVGFPLLIGFMFGNTPSNVDVLVDGEHTTNWFHPGYNAWQHLLLSRRNGKVNGTENARFAFALVNTGLSYDKNLMRVSAGVPGILIFPDYYVHPEGVPLPVNINGATFSANTYTPEQMALLAEAGVLFLCAYDAIDGTGGSNTGDTSGNCYCFANLDKNRVPNECYFRFTNSGLSINNLGLLWHIHEQGNGGNERFEIRLARNVE